MDNEMLASLEIERRRARRGGGLLPRPARPIDCMHRHTAAPSLRMRYILYFKNFGQAIFVEGVSANALNSCGWIFMRSPLDPATWCARFDADCAPGARNSMIYATCAHESDIDAHACFGRETQRIQRGSMSPM